MPTTKQSTRKTSQSKSSPSSTRKPGNRSGRPGREEQAEESVTFNEMQVEELVLQALETELGGVQIYETAIRCAQNDDLREEWHEYHEQTQHHVDVVQQLCQTLGFDPEKETPGRKIVRHVGESLVHAMEMALQEAPGEAAQLVAAECVTLAETKDHQNWSLIGQLVEAFGDSDDERREAFEQAYEEVEDEEDEHLYHTMGWSRELWIESLGMPAVLPPPEEEKDVKSMAGAAKAKASRDQMAKKAR